MQDATRTIDEGTAYGLKPKAYRKELVEVGPHTPMGELMRRYWQPVFVSKLLTSDKPHRVRVLGEDLILFRDKAGRPGLVVENCCHRGTSLYYGRIEEDGIRCCYHGWKFDAEGHCLNQPAEIDGGRNRERVRQPWYPVQELYGLVYAYMGPPEKKPILPRYEMFENLEADELVEIQWTPPYGPVSDEYALSHYNFNWLAAYENTQDAPHVPWLHYHHSGDQFTEIKLSHDLLPPYAQVKDMVATVFHERTDLGIRSGKIGPNGEREARGNHTMIPNRTFIPGFIDLLYTVPADNENYFAFMLWRSRSESEHAGINELHGGRTWWELTEEEHRRSPGDYEAQSSIGRVPAHNREHLAQGDLGVVAIRRRLEEAARDVAEGRDPPGTNFDPDCPPIPGSIFRLPAGIVLSAGEHAA